MAVSAASARCSTSSTVGEISPPAELRERVRSFRPQPPEAAPSPRRLPGLAPRRPQSAPRARPRPRRRCAVIAGALAMQTRTSSPVSQAHLRAADQGGRTCDARREGVGRCRGSPATSGTGALAPPPAYVVVRAPPGRAARTGLLGLAAARGRQRRRALALHPERARHRALARRRCRDGRLRHAHGRQRQRVIDLRVPVGRAQEALPPLLGARHDHGAAGADPRPPGRSRPSRAIARGPAPPHRPAQGQAAVAVADGRRVARRSRTASRIPRAPRERAPRCPRAQQRAAFARFSLDLVTGRGTAIAPPSHAGGFERTADDALEVISVSGRGALFAAIVGGPFLLLVGGAWWLARRLRRRAARRLLETS